ncbi:GntR family transcriptional regulator [Geothrix rubra]|uniref:GntR family transcriptional regulator n=1 Tax=Geothrix rubra TaxID=2927977 RepID=A0ABQ5Q9I4_9BACT|nr:PLP-dependent aminotransferase family protein [Geothrix rubra]GLH71282.1 GntR family transcriptional regulator [Geothrix rubra]
MRPWTFPIALQSGTAHQPVFQQIAQAVRRDIRRGRLRPGDALPGSRTLAATLGVHRNTVLAAYRELEAEGWIVSERRSTRVAPGLPEPPPGRARTGTGPGYDLASPTPTRLRPGQGGLDFGGGVPDLRLVPAELLARAYRRALGHPELLGYGDPGGEPRLRAALARLLSEMRGLAVSADRLMVAGGSQGALDLVARTLIRPGDRVAVEDPGYPAAWATLRAAGAELVPVPVDAAGLRVEALAEALAKGPLRAAYLTPHHQFPTTVTMGAARRLRLLELAASHRIALLEDDYDNEFHFEGRPVLPLAGEDPAGVVVYLGTLSKILAPGLRLGFVSGPQALVQALAARRATTDGQGDPVLQRAVAELLEDGLLQRHARKMRRTYEARREVLAEALRRHLGGAVAFDLPAGGMSLWLSVDPAIDIEAWATRAREAGVGLYTGRRFDFQDRPRPNLRLGFSALDERELAEAVRRMARAL